MGLKDKALKYLKAFFYTISNATFFMYLDIGRYDDDDYNDGESSDEDYYE